MVGGNGSVELQRSELSAKRSLLNTDEHHGFNFLAGDDKRKRIAKCSGLQCKRLFGMECGHHTAYRAAAVRGNDMYSFLQTTHTYRAKD